MPVAPVPCRILRHSIGNGPSNMALDQALLDAVDAEPTAAVLRTYEWSEPTLSLGYFQKYADAQSDPRWREIAMVRRPSGGGALMHDREVTYALVLPRSHPLAARPSALYRAVHDAIGGRMRDLGLDAARRGETPAGANAPASPFLCFLDRDPEDVLVGGVKVVGSAQRRRPSAVLQHGSILLGRSALAVELPGLADLRPEAVASVDWAAEVRDLFPRALGLAGVKDGPSERERSDASRLAREVYGNSGWTRRR